MNLSRTLKIAAVLLAVMVFSMAVYGFAAANTVVTSAAGDGQNTVSGYQITNVKYNLDAVDPGKIATVTFTLDTAPKAGSTIKIKLVDTGTDWFACTNATTTVTCTTSTGPNPATVATANKLRVVIAD
jgi:hypothetical protein